MLKLFGVPSTSVNQSWTTFDSPLLDGLEHVLLLGLHRPPPSLRRSPRNSHLTVEEALGDPSCSAGDLPVAVP